MSFNVDFGAGVDPNYQNLPELMPADRGKSRIPNVLKMIKLIQPDILGIQEATAWETGSPDTVAQIAGEFGYNYVLAEPYDGVLPVVLMTRYQIVEAVNLSNIMQRGLRATLLTPEWSYIQVWVVHLDSFSASVRACQVNKLLLDAQAQIFLAPVRLMIGDFNMSDETGTSLLTRENWQLVMHGTLDIDKILMNTTGEWFFEGLPALSAYAMKVSDHTPVSVHINFQSLPEPVGEAVSNVTAIKGDVLTLGDQVGDNCLQNP
jgi:endonuclease/exonuclease/phosphatase family metal-dependent hydrolase